MSNASCRLGRRLVLKAVLFAGLVLASSTLAAQATGSQAANIQFAQAWGVPAGFTQLDDYFASPGYVTLLELWAPG